MLRAPTLWPLFLFAVLTIGCATVRPLLREAGRPVAEPALNVNLLRIQPTLARSVTAPALNLDRREAAIALNLNRTQVAPAYNMDRPHASHASELATGVSQTGSASYYHPSLNGLMTANGETFDDSRLTAAHRTLRFGTRVRVTNLSNSKSVVVKINDRGPFVAGRIIDLSRRAANALGFVKKGVTRVRVQPLPS